MLYEHVTLAQEKWPLPSAWGRAHTLQVEIKRFFCSYLVLGTQNTFFVKARTLFFILFPAQSTG